MIALHDSPVTVQPNNFLYKSLSSWAANFTMGCTHGCGFCSVPDTSTSKQKHTLAPFGVDDPVAEWGGYALVRPWDEAKFIASVRKAEAIDPRLLKRDGNRAVFLSSTTDPYQVFPHEDRQRQKLINLHARNVVRSALIAIRDHSTLNVRILTRSPLARQDFDLFQSFGDRLLLGTSLPTLNDSLSRLYEGRSPSPKQRLKLLIDAKNAGIHTYVAVAPVFPECGSDGMLEVFNAVREADPWTVFMEPVNLRRGNVDRIRAAAQRLGMSIDMAPFSNPVSWSEYAIASLHDAERAAETAGIMERLHLWPDHAALATKAVLNRQPDQHVYLTWLNRYWHRISEWPGKAG